MSRDLISTDAEKIIEAIQSLEAKLLEDALLTRTTIVLCWGRIQRTLDDISEGRKRTYEGARDSPHFYEKP